MNEKQHKHFFISTVDRRLSALCEDPWLAQRIMNSEKGCVAMKRKNRKVLVVVIAVIVCLTVSVTAVAAAANHGIINLFSNGETTNENISDSIQSVGTQYKGESVSFTVNEALYDSIGETFALDWTIENLNDSENLYVICNGAYFGDERAHQRTTSNYSDFILEADTTECMMLGELPENDSSECRMDFVVLRGLAPFAVVTDESSVENLQAEAARLRSEGFIPVNSIDIVCGTPNNGRSYAENLLASGEFELAESFSLNFTLEQNKLDETVRFYNGPTEFVFDDYEIIIRNAYCTATAVYVDVEYITPEAPKDGGKGFGPLWGLQFDLPGKESWTGNAGGSINDPVQLEDGRYMNLYKFEAISLYTQPEVLLMTLVTYDDAFNATYHTEDAIELIFE